MAIEWVGRLEDKSVKELRKMLEPYTPYRHELTKAELISKIRKIRMAEVDPQNSVNKSL